MEPTKVESGVQPAAGTVKCLMHQWITSEDQDLYTLGLTDCCVFATWTANRKAPNSLMHVVGLDVEKIAKYLSNQVKENILVPADTHVIAVAGPDTGTLKFFDKNWYQPIKKDVKKYLTAQQYSTIKWGPAEFDLLTNEAPNAIKNCFALLQDGSYGPSHPPPPTPPPSHHSAPPSRHSASSSVASSASWGNTAAPATGRPGSSGSKAASPAPSRPSTSSGKAAASPAPSRPSSSSGATAGKNVGAAPGKAGAAAPATSRPSSSSGKAAASPAPSRPSSSSGTAAGKSPAKVVAAPGKKGVGKR